MNRSQLCAAIDTLAVKRPIFHSEKDFQHQLALQLAGMGYEVRLERPFNGAGGAMHIDIIASLNAQKVGFELKYVHRTSGPVVGLDRYGEQFDVVSNWGSNLTRYDVWWDYARLAGLVAAGALNKGYAILLTNAPALWQLPGPIMTRNFPLEDQAVPVSPMDWVWNNHTEAQKQSTAPGRLTPVHLPIIPRPLHWEEYTKENNDPSPIIGTLGHYRYLIIET